MSNLSKLQEKQLEIFREFIRICDCLNLRYFMVEGTMLGARRHQGFIPWDDDIDVGMPRKDYDVFVKKANSLLSKRFKLTTHLDDEHYWMTAILWDMDCKVKLSNATESIIKNVWIDIIPLDGMPNNSIRQKMHYYHFYLYRALYQASNFSKIVNVLRPRPFYERICIYFFQTVKLEKLLNSQKIGNKLHRVMSKYDYDKSEYVMQFISDYKMKELMPKNWFGIGKTYWFENTNAIGILACDKYLSRLYGEYMIFPPVEKRVGKHKAEIINAE